MPGRSNTTTSFGGGGLPGNVYNYDPAYGGIPGVPDPGASATSALGGDIGNLGRIYGLAGGLDTFNANNAASNLTANVPGLAERSRGQLPQDVINQIMQQAAERGISTGTSGSPNANGAYLRALGLTSLGVSTEAGREIGQAVGRAPILDTSRLVVTPEEQQNAQLMANIYRSAPIPSNAAGASLGNARAGLRQGLGSIPGFSGAGAYGGAKDALGFPLATSWDSSDSWNQLNPPAVGAINPSSGGPGSADPFAAWMAQYGNLGSNNAANNQLSGFEDYFGYNGE